MESILKKIKEVIVKDDSKKKEIEKFIGNTPWNKVKLIGYDGINFINGTLDDYKSIEDFLQHYELTQPDWLNLRAGKGEDLIIIDNCGEE